MSENSVVIWSDESKVAEIKKIYAPSLSPTEFQAFVGIGQSTGLNPFLKEIWAVKYGNNPASIFVGRDGYRKMAQANRDYDWHFVDSIYANDSFKVVNGQPEHNYKLSDRGTLIGAYALCMRKGSSRPNYTRVDFKEYNTSQSLWKTKPETMIKKVAEAQVLRMTFQDIFAGTYDESEEIETKNLVAPTEIAKRISGKTEEVVDIVEEVEEISEESPVTYISEDQSSKITNLFTQLGYDPAMIIEKTESLERKLGKPYDQFTQVEADSIISNMAKALKKKMEEEKEMTSDPVVEENKESAVGKMGKKAKEEQEAIKNSTEFKEAFGEDEATAEDASDVFDTPAENPYDSMSEEELKTAQKEAKANFSAALKKFREDGSNESLAERTRTSAICTEINQTLIRKGYDII